MKRIDQKAWQEKGLLKVIIDRLLLFLNERILDQKRGKEIMGDGSMLHRHVTEKLSIPSLLLGRNRKIGECVRKTLFSSSKRNICTVTVTCMVYIGDRTGKRRGREEEKEEEVRMKWLSE